MGARRRKHGWAGEGGDKEDYISHYSFHVSFWQSAILMLLQENTRATRYRGGLTRPQTPTRGRCPTSTKPTVKRRWAPVVSSSLLLSWPSPAVPVMVVSSRHHLEVTSVCRPEQELRGRANSREKHVIHYPPSDNTYDILAAPQQSQTFHRVPLLLFSIQRSLPRLKVRWVESLPVW